MSNPLGSALKRSKYRLLGLVGQGQFGRVFCAVHRRTGRLVALKNLEHQRFPTHKFLRELRILLSLQHSNIVTCYALEHTRTGRYLVMDYCEGGTLRNLIEGDCRLSIAQGFKLIVDILMGLDHAHSRGIVHCDIKPDNILLNVQSSGWVARISDFGIARLTQELVGHDGLGNTGSPAYMAPERFYGQYSHSSDLYAVGVLLFEMLTGYRPFSGTPAELMSGHLNQPVKLPDSIPEVWRSLLITALQKLPGRRFRSGSDMLKALREVGAIAGYASALESPIHLPLLQPLLPLKAHPCITQQQEPLQQAIAHLAIGGLNGKDGEITLYQATQQQCIFQSDITVLTQANFSFNAGVQISASIEALIPHRQGCFAVTQTAIMLVSRHPAGTFNAQVIASAEDVCLAAVESRGRWLAMVTVATTQAGMLSFVRLDSGQSPPCLAHQPIPLLNREIPQQWLRLIALDNRHVAVVARLGSGESTRRRGSLNAKTVFEVFARRGDRLGVLGVPLCLTQIHPTLTPYRLIAVDESDPYAVVIIDLKPFRILRFGVEIAPVLMESTAWGYVLVDAEGHIMLIDLYGQHISRIDGPPFPTAIAAFNSYALVIATWNQGEGAVHLIDLRELGIDLLF